MEKQTLIFLGPQGSGKGTQLSLIAEKIKAQDLQQTVLQYDSGGALRAFKESQGYTQSIVRTSLEKGEIQPDFLTTTIFGNILVSQIVTGNEHLIFDGYPRTLVQAELFSGAMRFYNRPLVTVIVLNLSQEAAVKRLLLRGRTDDTEEGIARRLGWYYEHSLPVVEYFKKNALYRVIDIDGDQTVEQVHANIRKKLGL